jgi:preprotein translocase subunit SecY
VTAVTFLAEIVAEVRGEAQNRWYMQGGVASHAMMELGKLLVLVGAILVIAGVAVMALGRRNVPLGRLPGDFLYRGKNTTVYFPLATSVVVSVVLSVVLYLVGRWRR